MNRDLTRATREAWLVSAVRTPVGRYGGALSRVRPDDLAALVIRAAVDRSGLPPERVEDVILGCANQAGEDNRNVARMAGLLAGLPVEAGGLTVNRLCGSGLQAINSAAHAIMVGDGDAFVAGGVESMSRAPLVTLKAETAFARGDRPARRHDPGLALRQPGPGRDAPAALHGRDGGGGGDPLRRDARGAGRVRPGEPAASRRRGGRRPLRRPDGAGPGAPAQGRARSS